MQPHWGCVTSRHKLVLLIWNPAGIQGYITITTMCGGSVELQLFPHILFPPHSKSYSLLCYAEPRRGSMSVDELIRGTRTQPQRGCTFYLPRMNHFLYNV